MSLVIKQTRIVEVPATTLSVAATCQNAHLLDASGMVVGRSLKMPEFVPTLLEIDLATGMIKNWTVPTVAQLQAIADAQCNGVPAVQYAASQASLNAVLMPSTQGVGHLSVYDGSKPDDVDESQMPYGYFDDERDPEKLGTDAPAGATHQNLETGCFYTSKNGEVYYFSAGAWWPSVATLHDLDVAAHVIRLPVDEPTDDEMRSRNKRRYAVTAKHEHAQTDPLPSITDTGELPSDYDDKQIDIEDLIEPNRQPARPRYRNPDDHSQTWTGRGKPPEWLQAKLDAGYQMTDYAISDSAA